MSNRQNKLVITRKNGIICYGYFRDGNPVELYCEPEEEQSLVGNIYAARVERVAREINGAFLEIGEKQKCYFALSSLKTPVKLSPGHEEELRNGDVILIQITKDAVKTKLPVGDCNISIQGKYFVLTLAEKRFGISRKIKKATERDALLALMEEYQSEEYGIVARTNAAGTGEELLREELQSLGKRYQELMRRARVALPKTLLYREPPHYITLGKELPEKDLTEILTDCPDILEELSRYYAVGRRETEKIVLYQDTYSLYNLYRFSHFYEEAAGKNIWLKSGGSIVIEQTEAMTVIDVNTGSVLKKKRQSDSLFSQLNQEAAVEIARQLRLRNLSGMILIDFINMEKESQKEKLLQLLRQECGKDRIPCKVIDMTMLNLVEMTRCKRKRPLHEQINVCWNYLVQDADRKRV